MPTQVQFRRGTTAQNNTFTGAAGEISVNTSNNTIRVHDGATAGGFELPNGSFGTANIANFINVTDDTTTNATRYLIFANGTSGAITEQVSSTKLTFNPSSGLLTSTDYNSSSDSRLKVNIKTIDNALGTIATLRGVSFDWKDNSGRSYGLIAQEVQEILPDVVTEDENGFLGIKYTNMIGILVEAIKEQQEQINTLKKLIEKL